MTAQRLPRHELVDPAARDRRGIQDSEPGLVVLEPHSARRAPHGNEVFLAAEPVGTRCQQPPDRNHGRRQAYRTAETAEP